MPGPSPLCFRDAFSVMPMPALLMDDVRVVAANRAADRLLGSLEDPLGPLHTIHALLSRPDVDETVVEMGSQYFRVNSTLLSRYSGIRLWLLFLADRADGADRCGPWGFSLPERRVAHFLGRGLRNREIAVQMGLSVETVRKHVAHVLSKSGAETRAAFVVLLLRPAPERFRP